MTMRKGEEAIVKINSLAPFLYEIKLIDFIKVHNTLIPLQKSMFSTLFYHKFIKFEPNLVLGKALLENGCSRKNRSVQIKEARRKHTLQEWEIPTCL